MRSVNNRDFFLLIEKGFFSESICTFRTNCYKTSVSRQTISKADVKKQRFFSAQVFGLPSLTDSFRFPS